MSNSILGNGNVIYFYLRKFGFNIFPDLKSKKIKLKNYLKKTKFAHFFVILTKKSLFTLFKTLFSQKLSHQLSSNKLSVIMIK